MQVFSLNPKAMVHFQLLLRLVKSIALLVVLAGLIVAIVSTRLSFTDVLASILAYVPTGWGILSVSFLWKLWCHEVDLNSWLLYKLNLIMISLMLHSK
jgi:callose synthase